MCENSKQSSSEFPLLSNVDEHDVSVDSAISNCTQTHGHRSNGCNNPKSNDIDNCRPGSYGNLNYHNANSSQQEDYLNYVDQGTANILTLLDSSSKVLVIGDTYIERYVYGNYAKLSKESSIPALKEYRRDIELGGVPNVVKNMKQMGFVIDSISIIGESDTEVINMLDKDGIDFSYFIKSQNYSARRFTKYFNNNFPVFMTEDAYKEGILLEDHKILKSKVETLLNSNEYSAVVLIDRFRSFLCDQICKKTLLFSSSRQVPVVVYSNNIKDFKKFRTSSCIVFNADRLEDEKDISIFCKEISERLEIAACVVTMSDKGTGLYRRDTQKPFHIIPFPERVRIIDTAGEGDAVVAACVFGIVTKWQWTETCHFANACAANVVQILGVAPFSMLDVIGQNVLRTKQEIVNLRRIIPQKRLVAVTTGCFDMIHIGHVESLRQAKTQADICIVLLNSDKSVKLYKGDERPILTTEQRCSMLLATKYVDFVVVFDDRCPDWIVEILSPDIFVKGEEYREKDLRENYPFLKKIVYTPQLQSTSSIIECIKKL